MIPLGVLAAAGSVPSVVRFIALPLTYDEADADAAMVWVRQGSGPHVTPTGFEGDGYGALLKSTTVPAWIQPMGAALTLHATVAFYPQQLKGTAEYVVFAGEDTSAGLAKLGLYIAPDAANSQISQMAVRGMTGVSSFFDTRLGRSGWTYQFRVPEVTSGGYQARPQAILFLDDETVLVSAHYEDQFSNFYVVDIATGSVTGQFTAGGDWVHVGVIARRANGDLWVSSAAKKMCRLDLEASLLAGTMMFDSVVSHSFLTEGMGGIEFVTVSGTEYLICCEYRYTSGTPYLYVFDADAVLAMPSFAAGDRHKRFLGIPREVQGCAMRSGLLVTGSNDGGVTGAARFGYVKTFDVVAAITGASDGATIATLETFDAPTKYAEDVAVHPTTNELWMGSEGITSVGGERGGLSWWSSALDGQMAENHYTVEYDGSGVVKIKVNNRIFDEVAAVLARDVDCVTVGGPPGAAPAINARYFTGFVRDVVLQDQPMTSAQYLAAVNGEHEPNSLTAYAMTLVNPGAESGSATGWVAELGGMVALQYPGSTGTAPKSGEWIFSGGNHATSRSRQRLDVLAQTGLSGGDVDSGDLWVKARWWQTNADTVDSGDMGVRTLDGSLSVLGEEFGGVAVMPNVSGAYRPWYPRCLAAELPAGTRSIDALIRQVRASGTVNDAQFDEVSIVVYRQ